ncbi:hypothetical protein [Flavobacterium faecale]|uniref:hypothetical protein n=1 Tax=Flavobacterium faecale TaxID=1355330 RepID=UPI003AAF4469
MEDGNPFKSISVSDQEVPKDLREKVMDDVNTIKLLLELADLFSLNYANIIEGMFKTKNRNIDKNTDT